MGRKKLTGVEMGNIKAEVKKRYVRLEEANEDFLRVFRDKLALGMGRKDGKIDNDFARKAASFLAEYASKHDIEDINEEELYTEIKDLSFWEDVQRLFNSKLGKIAYSLLFPVLIQLYKKYKEVNKDGIN